MTGHEQFGHDYWADHWHDRGHEAPPHPCLADEVATLAPGTALDAGCGIGAEAIWLAGHGWRVTGVDIAERPLARAADEAARLGVDNLLTWRQADLSEWDPERRFDLVVTFYAHAAIPQLDLYARLASWVAPGGTLLVVGHRHGDDHGHEQRPSEAEVTAVAVASRLDAAGWRVVTSRETRREVRHADGSRTPLDDVIVRVHRSG